jgi:hypothetical protein
LNGWKEDQHEIEARAKEKFEYNRCEIDAFRQGPQKRDGNGDGLNIQGAGWYVLCRPETREIEDTHGRKQAMMTRQCEVPLSHVLTDFAKIH